MASYVHVQTEPAIKWEFDHLLGTTNLHQSVWVQREDGLLCSMAVHWMAIDETYACAEFTVPCVGRVILTAVEVPDGRGS